MARTLRTPHAALPSYTTADALFLLRCDDLGGAVDMADALGLRPMTQSLSPGAAYSIFSDAAAPSSARGARTFDGATQFAGRTTDADAALFQSLVWGIGMWIKPTAIATSALIEFGEWSSPETQATNVQAALNLLANGGLRMFWENGAGINVTTDTAGGFILSNTAYHVGVACEPDPNFQSKARLRFYVNGECVSIQGNIALMDGGSTARWIIAASRNGGTAVGTPGSFYAGALDDIIVTKFSPTHEWFREAYANGLSWFFEKHTGSVPVSAGLGDTTGAPFGTMQEVHTRVLVEVSNGGTAWPSATAALTLRNLTDLDLNDVGYLGGVDLVKRCDFGDNIDDIGQSASIELIPRFGFWNLSPLVDLSLIQTVFQNRAHVKIEQAFVPIGTTRDGATPFFRLMFEGWAMNPEVQAWSGAIQVLGPHGPLSAAWVEPAAIATANEVVSGDRAYGSSIGVALETIIQSIIDDHDPAAFTILSILDNGATWTLSLFSSTGEHGQGRPATIAAADVLLVSGTVNYNGNMTLTSGGATGGVATTVLNRAAETVGLAKMVPGQSYRGRYPSLWTPTSPSFNVFTFNEPPTKSVYSAIQAWADEIGWHCRYRWDDTRKQFRLKLYDPRAAGSTIVLTADQLYMPQNVSLKHDFQRTVGVVEYASNANTDNKGERLRYCVGSVVGGRNGDRYYFRVVNDSKSIVTTSAAAQKELDAIMSDLAADPSVNADATVDIPASPQWDINDGGDILSEYATDPNQQPIFFGYESFPFVNGWRTTVDNGKIRTTLIFGKVGASSGGGNASVSREKWHNIRLGPIGRQIGLGLRSPNAPAAPTVTSPSIVIGATRMVAVSWSFPVGDQNRAFDIMEVHASVTTGFTPTPATLKGVFRGTLGLVAHGIGVGVGGFVKIIATDSMGNRSAASAQTAFTS